MGKTRHSGNWMAPIYDHARPCLVKRKCLSESQTAYLIDVVSDLEIPGLIWRYEGTTSANYDFAREYERKLVEETMKNRFKDTPVIFGNVSGAYKDVRGEIDFDFTAPNISTAELLSSLPFRCIKNICANLSFDITSGSTKSFNEDLLTLERDYGTNEFRKEFDLYIFDPKQDYYFREISKIESLSVEAQKRVFDNSQRLADFLKDNPLTP